MKKKISVDSFLKKYSGIPWDEAECASEAENVKGELGDKASAFLKARDEFLDLLNEIGYEFG